MPALKDLPEALRLPMLEGQDKVGFVPNGEFYLMGRMLKPAKPAA